MATQARSNIAIANDCISGVFTPNAVITINGTDRSTSVRIESLRLTLNRNEEPDYAEFIVNRDGGFTPTAGQTVTIGLGDNQNLIFGGQVGTVNHTRLSSSHISDYEIRCIDWNRMFNRRLVTANFSGQSATTIAQSIVSDYTSGFFDYAIETGLATIDEFICVNETPLGVLTRLANLLGGGCYIDPSKIVHLWSSSLPSIHYAPSPPAQLTNSLETLKRFVPEHDYSQVRTKVIVEGRSALLREPIPAGADLATYGVPIDHDGQWFFNTATDAEANFGRIGPMVVSYEEVHNVLGPPFAFVTTTPAVAGDTSVVFNQESGQFGAGIELWCYEAGGSYFVATLIVSAGADDALSGIPATGYGSLKVDLPVGTPIFRTGHLRNVTVLAQSGEVEADIDIGEAVVVRSEVNDTGAQTAIAAIEGGDGIHEYLVSDGDLTYVGCVERAEAELVQFSESLVRAEWLTHDPQALPGATQSVNLSSPEVVSTTVTIDSVSIDFPIDNTNIAASPAATCASNRWPRRVCRGSTVKLATIFDAIHG